MTPIGHYSPIIFAYMLDAFIVLGIIYYILGIIDHYRWWNGIDDNGNPK